MIDDAGQAKRLAQAICSDIALYSGEAKNAPIGARAGLIAGPIKEGRELYLSRVSPTLGWIFDEAVATLITPMLGVELKSAPSQPTPSPALAQPIQESGGSTKLVVVVAIGLLAAAAAFLLLK